MKKTRPPWPLELRKPIVVEDIKKSIPPQPRMKYLQLEIGIAISSERFRRLELIAQHLNRPVPTSDEEWLRLLVAICRFWEVPAFEVAMVKPRGPGANLIWTDQKHCELFADVQATVTNGLTETAACQFIASNPRRFGGRYDVPKTSNAEKWKKTLTRQYVTAKLKITSSPTFRSLYFSEDTGADVHYGAELISRAIRQFAYTRNSPSDKSA